MRTGIKCAVVVAVGYVALAWLRDWLYPQTITGMPAVVMIAIGVTALVVIVVFRKRIFGR